mgnify:CR=1 FL=1
MSPPPTRPAASRRNFRRWWVAAAPRPFATSSRQQAIARTVDRPPNERNKQLRRTGFDRRWLLPEDAYNEPEALVDFADVLAGSPAGRPASSFCPRQQREHAGAVVRKTRFKVSPLPSGYFIDHTPSTQRARTYPWLDASYTCPTNASDWAA